LTFGSLFAGIGGFDLGFERAGMTCKWQVEIDPYCQRVLAKHWPDVRRHDDIRTFPPDESDAWRVDVICGGFPCQDISNLGSKVGIHGIQSGLWREYQRVLRTLRPRFAVIENVPALLGRGLSAVLGDLASIGFDAEWSTLSACSMGASHLRRRLFIVAYPYEQRPKAGWLQRNGDDEAQAVRRSHSQQIRSPSLAVSSARRQAFTAEPDVGRVANGIPARVDRLSGLGNAVVPQVAEWIGRRLIESAL
jgi:DNA (cytosine-5)-methyltransferase 1